MSDTQEIATLDSFLRLDGSLDELVRKLRAFSDRDTALVALQADHVQSILNRFVAGKLTSLDVENWAEVVEVCDAIGFEPDQEELLKETVFALANPTICGEITPTHARHLLSRFQSWKT